MRVEVLDPRPVNMGAGMHAADGGPPAIGATYVARLSRPHQK